VIGLGYEGRRVFRPVSFPYLFLLALASFALFSLVFFLVGDLLMSALGFSASAVFIFLFVSLAGSFVNVPVATLESRVPIVVVREVSAFGVRWRVPDMRVGVKRIHVLINVGGALLPIIVSGYLLGQPLVRSGSVFDEYLAVAAVLVMVTVVVNQSAQVVAGLGVATPAIVPPLVTALATILINWITPLHNPAQIAYIGGTLGTLIGADLLNLENVRDVGAPTVSIGGAGTFDGIYLTGMVSVLLVFLVLG
jgi:uncharacterized membrane protein